MKDKEKLNEGRISRFLDKVFYKILNGINDKIVKSIRQDPEMKKKIDDFERSKDNLLDALQRLADNPEKYAKTTDDSDQSVGPPSEEGDDDTPEFLRKMED